VQKCLILVFYGEFIIEKLGQFVLDLKLLPSHVVTNLLDLLSDVRVMLSAEAEFSFQLQCIR